MMFLPSEVVFAELHAHEDTKQIHASDEKISKSFEKIERVALEDKPFLPGEDS